MIDWIRIRQLRSEIGEDGFAEVLDIFLDEVAETLTDLVNLPEGPDRLARLHFLKGSALNLGFQELANLCRTAEADQSAVSPQQIVAAFDAAKDSLMEGLGSRAAPAA